MLDGIFWTFSSLFSRNSYEGRNPLCSIHENSVVSRVPSTWGVLEAIEGSRVILMVVLQLACGIITPSSASPHCLIICSRCTLERLDRELCCAFGESLGSVSATLLEKKRSEKLEARQTRTLSVAKV